MAVRLNIAEEVVAGQEGGLAQNIMPHIAPAYTRTTKGIVGLSSATAIILYCYKYMNAIWGGAQMRLGDGDGTVFGDFTIFLDILTHEMINGLVSNTCNFVYQGQAGDVSERRLEEKIGYSSCRQSS